MNIPPDLSQRLHKTLLCCAPFAKIMGGMEQVIPSWSSYIRWPVGLTWPAGSRTKAKLSKM